MTNESFRWVRAVQRRVGIASTVLRQMKSIKLSGLVESMAQLVQSERVRELQWAKQFRGLMVWVQTVSNFPTTFSPPVAFAVYSIKAKIDHTPQLTTAQAFTSLAILTLLTAPASQLLGSIPMLTSGWGCAKRVHAFISTEPFDDTREISGDMDHGGQIEDNEKSDEAEKSSQGSERPVLSVTNLILKSAQSSENPEKTAITFEASKGTFITVLGPVGCGKSTLLRSILGEIKPVSGTIAVRTPFIAYCSQSPWLPNAPIRDMIVGPNKFDEEWYHKIIALCDLESDFSQMPQNDTTLVGNRGIVLSGGQKHRVVSSLQYCNPGIAVTNTRFYLESSKSTIFSLHSIGARRFPQ
jgi:ATP-binding cassette, subfamily C (CFTR/MRP), member 1